MVSSNAHPSFAPEFNSAFEPLRSVTSPTIVLNRSDIDTDQIIPARFLTTTSRDGLAEALFADWRSGPGGELDSHCPLNAPGARRARVLVAGSNFGCGSSREHAAWALRDFGFRVVISDRIADIFTANATRSGILPARVEAGAHRALLEAPGAVVTVNLERTTITLPDGRSAPFYVDAFARRCLLNGVDELGYLLARKDAIARYEEAACEL